MEDVTFSLSLGKGNSGLSLKAQLVDESAVNVGSEVTTGFAEIGDGFYIWISEVSDNFRGGVKFLNASTDELLVFSSVVPNKLSPSGLDLISIENGVNARQALSVISAVLGGVIETGTGEVTIKAIGDANITRVTAQVTSAGDRTTVTLNVPT